ncbi:MAG: hypothetical protein QM740_10070 [Acidovorax sp.]
MPRWTAFPHPLFRFDAANIRAAWPRLHRCDAEPCPQDPAVLQAWALFHAGDFERAAAEGLAAGGAGVTAANKATAIYACYLEPREATRFDLFLQVAERAEAQTRAEPGNANAWFWRGYALARYSQGISVARALAQGLGIKVKESLEATIALAPQHVDARLALGAYHAEVIDKVGPLIGHMTYGARKEVGLKLFDEALALAPDSPIALMEQANALVMLEGPTQADEATRLYERAAACEPADALEQLQVDLARAELADG